MLVVMTREVPEDRAARSGEHGDAPSSEEDVFGSGVAGSIGFREDFAARAIPVELAASLGHAPARTVVKVGDASGGLDLAFRVKRIGIDAVRLRVPETRFKKRTLGRPQFPNRRHLRPSG